MSSYAVSMILRPISSQARRLAMDSRTLRSNPQSGHRAGYDGTKKRGSKLHIAVDTLGNLLAAHVTPANEQDRAQVGKLAAEVQEATGDKVKIAFADQGYTGDMPATQAAENGIELLAIKLAEAKRDFVLMPRRWVVERSFGWLARFRRLARDYERLPQVVTGLHFIAFACLLLNKSMKNYKIKFKYIDMYLINITSKQIIII